MARAIWSGAISFGLVNIPVQLYSAVRDKTIHFHQICQNDKSRVRQKLVCEGNQEELTRDQLVKGYEIAPDQYVIFEGDELDKLAPEKSQAIEVDDFVEQGQIDPLYFDKPYYLLPKGNSAKAYMLLLKAMKDAQKIGICKFVMRGKEYLAAIRPMEKVICLELMRFADEVVEEKELGELPAIKAKVKDSELGMAKQLIETLAGDFDPRKYHNEYRDRVNAAIETKAQGQEIVTGPAIELEPTKVADLMSALKNSLEHAKKKRKQTA